MVQSRLTGLASLTALSFPLIALSGWTLDLPSLRSVLPGMPEMIPVTAFNIIALAFSLIFARQDGAKPNPRSFKAISLALASLAIFAGSVTLLWHIMDRPTGLDQLFMPWKVTAGANTLFRGNMSVQTSCCVIFLGVSMVSVHFRNWRRSAELLQILPIAVIGLSLLALTGYLNSAKILGPAKYLGLSIPSATAFAVLAIGVLGLVPDLGFTARARGKTSAALFLRWYTTVIVVAPILITALISWGESHKLYPGQFSDSLLVIITISSLFIMGVYMSGAIDRLERQSRALENARAKAALHESEQSLKETKDRLEFALEASSMGAWEINLETLRITFSGMAGQLYGLGAGDLPRDEQELFRYIHPEDRQKVLHARDEAIAHHHDLEIDFRSLWPDGSLHWLRTKGRAKYVRGKATSLSGTLIDITNEKSYQTTIEEALRAAESANQLKTTFLANMSHEIRTPLGAILGFTDLLLDPDISTDERKHHLEIIARNGKTLSHLLNDILDLSKVEAGRLDIEKIRFSPREVLDEIISLLRVSAGDKAVELILNFDASVPELITSDPTRLKQILINLIGNSIKFTSAGHVGVRVTADGDKIFFEITDTGIGIDETQKENLFQLFSQADGSMTRKFGGTGLGLVLSRRLAGLLGGTVELIRSRLGHGSTFLATIENFKEPSAGTPLASNSGVARAGMRGGATAKILQGIRVLLVEDSLDNQKLLSRVLIGNGAEVELAQNGLEGVEKARSSHHDVILMDIQMPVLDGFAATSRLRSEGLRTPIIALTAHAMSDVRQRCMDVGCSGHLTKPIDKQQLLQAIIEYAQK